MDLDGRNPTDCAQIEEQSCTWLLATDPAAYFPVQFSLLGADG